VPISYDTGIPNGRLAFFMRVLLFFSLIAMLLVGGQLAMNHRGVPLSPTVISFWKGEAPQMEGLRPSLNADASVPGVPVPKPARVAAQAANEVPPPPPAPSREKLRLLTEGAYPPFNYRNDQGALSGFDVDIARVLCVRLGVECEIIARPWNELVPALRRGQGQAIVASMLIPAGTRKTIPQAKGITFTNHYYSTPGHFAARRLDPQKFEQRPPLAQSRIAVTAGTIHSAFVVHRFAGARITEYASLKEAQAALESGNADLLFADRNTLLRWTATTGLQCCELVGSIYNDAEFFGVGAGIAVREEDVLLRSRLNKALARIVADGTYARISARYFAQSIY